ncbi:hypothetical protein DPMN_083832 [Dreissena polymorpha]|uniref:Uncharacterized protein n=1 Tax=Dreissena polymorpha TaxID=45954 RepID=A0A9D4BK91_DREPO|nr:hypothetical protein DPMN_083832 [Dreissena polymorpha]
MQERDYQPLAARGQLGSEYDRLADRDVLPRQYDDVEITETSFQSDVPQYRATLAARTMVTKTNYRNSFYKLKYSNIRIIKMYM